MKRSALLVLILSLLALPGGAQSVSISNASFETATLAFTSGNGSYSNVISGSTIGSPGGTLANWTATTSTTAAAAGAFAPTSGGVNWTSTWWSGSNIGYLQVNAAGTVSISQTVAATLQTNTTYTLSAKVGRRIYTPRFNYALQLWAGSTLLTSASNLALASNTSGSDQALYTTGANSPVSGQPLIIVLASTGIDGTTTEAFFDNISLTASTGAPGGGTPSTITLAVSQPSTAQLGQTETLTGTVTPSSATGTVTFFDYEAVLGIATLSGGQASLSTVLLPTGPRSLRAYYSGDITNAPSLSTKVPLNVAAIAPSSFAAAATYNTATGPSDLAIGDFNGDGKPDLAVVTPGANKMSILLGAGGGTFATHVDYDLGGQCFNVAAGDFNGDGKTDLAVSCLSGSVRIFLGSGSGSFAAGSSNSVGSGAQGMAVADLNLDGKADIVVANSGAGSLSVLIGKGDGTFQTAIPLSAGSSPRGVAVGDFNLDGIPDLAVANNGGGTIGILLGIGNGAFSSMTSLNTGGSPFYLKIADLNGDGREDIIATNLSPPSSGNSITVVLNNGDGTFQPGRPYTTGPGPRGLAVGDFNGDGHPDIVTANAGASTVSLLLNNGDGTFQSPLSLTIGSGPSDVIVDDLNGDGLPDIAAALFNNMSGTSVGVLLGSTAPPSLSTDPDHWIYTDSLVNAWHDCSWATVGYGATSPVHSGANSISVAAGPGQALCVDRYIWFDSSIFGSLSFWVNGGASGGQLIEVEALVNNVSQTIFQLPPLAANTWQQITVPLSSLGAANTPNLNGFLIQNATGLSEATFYVDDIKLTEAPPPMLAHLSVNAANVVRTAGYVGVNAAIWDSVFDTPTTVSMLTDINNQALRFPGGSISDYYHWATNMTTGGTVWANSPDHFAHVATTTPPGNVFITANYGTGTPSEAAAWVTNTNLTHSYGFKYWEILNEVYGSWETDNNTRPHDPYTYAVRFKDYFNQMKAVDPTIKVGAVVITGEDNYANYTDHPATNPRTLQIHNGWTPVMLATLKSLGVTPDYVIYHRYEQQPGEESDAGLLQSARTWPNDAADLRQQLTDYLGSGPAAGVEIVCTEHNSVAYNVGKQTTSVVNALFMADSIGQVLQTEFRSVVWWDMRNDQESTHNNSPVLYGWRQYGDYGLADNANPGTAADRYPVFYIAKLLKRFARAGDQIVNASTNYSLLSVYAAKRGDGSLSVLVVNKSPANALSAAIDSSSFAATANASAYSYGVVQDNAANGGFGSTDVVQTSIGPVAGTFNYTFPPYSATVISLVPAAPKKKGGQLTSQ
jgi:hypothetical protein